VRAAKARVRRQHPDWSIGWVLDRQIGLTRGGARPIAPVHDGNCCANALGATIVGNWRALSGQSRLIPRARSQSLDADRLLRDSNGGLAPLVQLVVHYTEGKTRGILVLRIRISDREFEVAGWMVAAILGLIAALAAFFIQEYINKGKAVSDAARALYVDANILEIHVDDLWGKLLAKEIDSFGGCDFLGALEQYLPGSAVSVEDQQGVSACEQVKEFASELLPIPLRSCPPKKQLTKEHIALIEAAKKSAAGYFSRDHIALIQNDRLVKVIILTKTNFEIQINIAAAIDDLNDRFEQAILMCQMNRGIALFRDILACIKSGLKTIEAGDDYKWPSSCETKVEEWSAFRGRASGTPGSD